MRILLALEPRSGSTDRLRRVLEDAGCEVVLAAGPRDAEHRATAQAIDAVAFEPTLVDDELRLRIRARRPALPLLAWLPVSSAERTAELLAAGVDEVLHPAMGEPELAARTTAAIRRGVAARPPAVELGPLRVDLATGEASWHDRELPLTRRERELLLALAQAPGQALPREALYRRVWGYAMARGDRTVDVNVRRLRAKLAAAAGDAVSIRTQTGIGYRLEVAEPAVTRL